MTTQRLTLGVIAERLGTTTDAPDLPIAGVNTLDGAAPGDLTFIADLKYRGQLKTSQASAVLVSEGFADQIEVAIPVVRVPDAAAAVTALLAMFAPPVSRPPAGVDPSAHVADSATLGRDVAVGHHCSVGERVSLGHGTVLHPGVVLGDDVTVGEGCELFPNVVVRERCVIGHRVTINANSTIGTDGFGYRFDGRQHVKIPHLGNVVIEDDVEIGSGTTIDRGKFAETRIGAGTKIDNLVQIAHNVQVGRLCIICANCGIAGSTVLGDGVILAGGVGLKDHIKLGTRARVGGYSGVHEDVPPGMTMVGSPATSQRQFIREQATLRKLPELMKQIRELQKKVDELQASRP